MSVKKSNIEKAERINRLVYFNKVVLPSLKKKYCVVPYQSMYKIKTSNGGIFDYYPMAQKMRNCNTMKWISLTCNQLMERFKLDQKLENYS